MIKQTFTVKTPPTNKGIKKGLTEGEFTFNAVRYETSDNDKFKQLYEAWQNFSSVGNYFNQRVNTPEGLSEGVVSKDIDGIFRKISSKKNKHGLTKFDCYDSINNKIVEVKIGDKIEVKSLSEELKVYKIGVKYVMAKTFIHSYKVPKHLIIRVIK